MTSVEQEAVYAEDIVDGYNGNDITWTLDKETGKLVITGKGRMWSADDGPGWMFYKDYVKEVVISEGITSIADHAFRDFENLYSVDLPDSVTEIKNEAFEGCKSLTSIELPEGLEIIRGKAFYGTGLTSITLPESLTTIYDSAFALSEIAGTFVIPENVTYIGDSAFYNCNFESVEILGSVKNIETKAFYSCRQLKSVILHDGIETIGNQAFQECYNLESIIFSEGIISIGDSAFNDCYNLKEVILPDSLTTIGAHAFMDCENLTEVVIPDGVTSIGKAAFDMCERLETVVLPDSLTSIEESVFYMCDLKEIKIPKGVTSIGDSAFERCNNLTSVIVDSPEIAKKFNWTDEVKDLLLNAEVVYVNAGISDVANLKDLGFTDMEEVTMDDIAYKAYRGHYHKDASGDDLCDKCGQLIESQFMDVSRNDYFYYPVLWAVNNGVTSGWTEFLFAPNMDCTRAQVVTFLWRANGKPAPGDIETSFTDVEKGTYYYDAVHWAASTGITYGYGDGTFGAEDTVTRAQFVTFLWRSEGEPKTTFENPFADIEEEKYYYDAILWAVENGVTAGFWGNRFEPDFVCTRGQVVSFLYRAKK